MHNAGHHEVEGIMDKRYREIIRRKRVGKKGEEEEKRNSQNVMLYYIFVLRFSDALSRREIGG